MNWETIKAWSLVAVGIVIVMVGVACSLPFCLDRWDKARAQTRIEVKDMEAVADYLREQRVRAALIGNVR